MAATVVKFMLDGYYASSSTNCPVIMKGTENEDWIGTRVFNTTTAQTRIGSLWAFTGATTTRAGDYAGDGAAGNCIVYDSVWNRSVIQDTNSGAAWTKALTVNAASKYIDVAIPIRPCIISLEMAVSETMYFGTAIECTTAGLGKIFANGPVIGHSLGDKDNGNTAVYMPVLWNPLGIGLTT